MPSWGEVTQVKQCACCKQVDDPLYFQEFKDQHTMSDYLNKENWVCRGCLNTGKPQAAKGNI